MAKKAKAEKVELSELEKTTNAITKDYGGVIKRASDVISDLNQLKILNWSPVLDNLLNGGIREGTIVGLAAAPKEGKTTSVLHFIAVNQKLYPEKVFVYVNTEGRVNKDNFEGVKGLDVDNLIVVESTKEKKLSGEDFLDIVEKYMNLHPGAVIVIDSLSNLIPETELNGKIDGSKRDKLPRLLSVFFKRCSGTVTNNKIILFCVAHFIADTGPSRKTRMTDCGNMFKYQVQTNLEISYTQPWDVADQPIGQKMHWKVLTSNTGAIPRSTDVGWLKYGTGIDEVQELLITACEFGILKLAGAWYKLTFIMRYVDHPDVKRILEENNIDPTDEDKVGKFFQQNGAANFNNFLNENPFMLDIIRKEVSDVHKLVS